MQKERPIRDALLAEARARVRAEKQAARISERRRRDFAKTQLAARVQGWQDPSPREVNASLKARYARNKGKRGEYEVARALQAIMDKAYMDAFVYLAERADPHEQAGMHLILARQRLTEIKARGALMIRRNAMQASCGGCDLIGCQGFSPEVKYQERLNITAWSAQTVTQAAYNTIPMLWYRRSCEEWRMRIFMRNAQSIAMFADMEYKEACAWLHAFFYKGFVTNVWKLL